MARDNAASTEARKDPPPVKHEEVGSGYGVVNVYATADTQTLTTQLTVAIERSREQLRAELASQLERLTSNILDLVQSASRAAQEQLVSAVRQLHEEQRQALPVMIIEQWEASRPEEAEMLQQLGRVLSDLDTRFGRITFELDELRRGQTDMRIDLANEIRDLSDQVQQLGTGRQAPPSPAAQPVAPAVPPQPVAPPQAQITVVDWDGVSPFHEGHFVACLSAGEHRQQTIKILQDNVRNPDLEPPPPLAEDWRAAFRTLEHKIAEHPSAHQFANRNAVQDLKVRLQRLVPQFVPEA